MRVCTNNDYFLESNCAVKDPVGTANDNNRPIGHTTHNLYVYDKKTKQKYLVVGRQCAKLDLKKGSPIYAASGAKVCTLV